MATDKFVIGHLYPGLMNLYGDRGNIMALRKRALLRGIDVVVVAINPGSPLTPGDVDMYFFGGGQDSEQNLIYDDFITNKGVILSTEIKNGVPCLAVCGGYQLLGKYYEVAGGKKISGIGVLDIKTISGKGRLIGNVLIEAELDGKKFEMVGFENHGGRTHLGEGVASLGKVIVGNGNNGEDGYEGLVYNNTVATYLHGPILPKNYQLTDFFLNQGMQRKKDGFVLEEISNKIELAAFESAKKIAIDQRNLKIDNFNS